MKIIYRENKHDFFNDILLDLCAKLNHFMIEEILYNLRHSIDFCIFKFCTMYKYNFVKITI